MKSILFSPIGGTDPIANFRDGAMLHILRVYKPDEVILYMSKEMARFHHMDNRYLEAIKKLEERIGHTFKVNLILKEDLVEVQRFDYFYREFREIIEGLRKEENTRVFLNISSGTPAMKAALNTLSVLSEHNETAIQVSTPAGKINTVHEDKEDYDLELLWEGNEDNGESYKNRCFEEKSIYLYTELKKEIIRKHVDAFDYHAAVLVLDDIPDGQVSKDVKSLITAVYHRTNLNVREFDKMTKKLNLDLVPIKDGHKRPVFEYVSALRLKLLRREYADYIRAISPAISELFFMSIKNFAGIDLMNYVKKDHGGYQWNDSAVNNNKDLKDTLITNSRDSYSRFVTTYQLNDLIQKFCTNSVISSLAKELRDIEMNIRNIAAHAIVAIDEKFILSKTGVSPEKILKQIQSLMQANLIDIKDDNMLVYEKSNELIKNWL